jgi:hypothetical protein
MVREAVYGNGFLPRAIVATQIVCISLQLHYNGIRGLEYRHLVLSNLRTPSYTVFLGSGNTV